MSILDVITTLKRKIGPNPVDLSGIDLNVFRQAYSMITKKSDGHVVIPRSVADLLVKTLPSRISLFSDSESFIPEDGLGFCSSFRLL